VAPVGPVKPILPVGPVGPATPGLTHDAGVLQTKAAVFLELTIAIDAQTTLVGVIGGVVDQPVGGTPTLVVKSHEPPVGVAGAVADSLNMNHSK
jgi:hypothetical protein